MFDPVKKMFDRLMLRRNSDTVRDAITELIQESKSEENSLNDEEKTLISNVLNLRDATVDDVMIPRADIVAVSADTSFEKLIDIMAHNPFTRLPVFNQTLDDVLGHIHVKDVALWSRRQNFSCRHILQQVLFVPPSMRLLDLLLHMRTTQIPMALVVDEYGGVDGLVTSWDVIREVMGELQNDDSPEMSAQLTMMGDGTYLIDGRVSMAAFEETFGDILTDMEREEDIETVGGFVLAIAGRVPYRKEVITHSSGFAFEVIDANPRRITRLRLHVPPLRGAGQHQG